MREELNQAIKDAASAVRQRGEPIEIFWDGETEEPWCQDIHGNWNGDLTDLRTLRSWINRNLTKLDGKRTATIYCRGDNREVVLIP